MLNWKIGSREQLDLYASDLTKMSANWILQLDLYLIWRKNSWNWILQFDLHLIWRKKWKKLPSSPAQCGKILQNAITLKNFREINSLVTYLLQNLICNIICPLFDGKLIKLNTATWFAFDLTEKMKKNYHHHLHSVEKYYKTRSRSKISAKSTL